MFMIVALCGCDKDRKLKEMIAETHDAVRGSYELKGIEWLGEDALDLDGDGKASTDLFAEFVSVFALDESRMEIGLSGSYVKPHDEKNYAYITIEGLRKGSISLSLPFQCITENIINGKAYYSIFPMFLSNGLYYYVLDDGSYSIEPFSPGWSGSQPVDMSYIDNGKVTFPAPGRILLEIKCKFYDYSTDRCIAGAVRFSFERYSFEVKF